ncbi:hypothetical protein O3P69_005467 [Scylla paramamosain]|uniref:Uncharacterized protein n=1 Tax=Scylla paramamosain TaxID=85552 RepID=A0AAW0U8L9_SCYPA
MLQGPSLSHASLTTAAYRPTRVLQRCPTLYKSELLLSLMYLCVFRVYGNETGIAWSLDSRSPTPRREANTGTGLALEAWSGVPVECQRSARGVRRASEICCACHVSGPIFFDLVSCTEGIVKGAVAVAVAGLVCGAAGQCLDRGVPGAWRPMRR